MARHGLAWKDLAADNPRLVMLSISGFGQEGPEAQRAAYAAVLHAECGLVARQAEQDRATPTDPVLSIADMNAGLHGLVAILAALRLRDRTGRGQHIDMALFDAMLVTDDYANFALDAVPLVRGGGELWDAPGGPVMIVGDFRVVWKLLVKHGGVSDPTPAGAPLDEKIRLRRRAAARYFASFADRASLVDALDAMNLAWGDVRDNRAAFGSATARVRGTVAQVDDRGGSTRPVVQSPYRFSGAASGARGGPAWRGEHNRDVLSRWLRASQEEIAKLENEGVLHAEDQP
jgi:CoA:oxalate CoA-transferase